MTYLVLEPAQPIVEGDGAVSFYNLDPRKALFQTLSHHLPDLRAPQVPTPIVEGDGAFSFHIPLPNPKGPIRAFLDRVREVLSSPLPPHYAPHLNALVAGTLLEARAL